MIQEGVLEREAANAAYWAAERLRVPDPVDFAEGLPASYAGALLSAVRSRTGWKLPESASRETIVALRSAGLVEIDGMHLGVWAMKVRKAVAASYE